ncbi:MAG: hypothetical protein Fur002_05320 [Anaerolineales bacterium]
MSKVLFLTCMPLETPRSASMAFMGILLEKYPDLFAWYSLRAPAPEAQNPFAIPYQFSPSWEKPARFSSLKHFIKFFIWARYAGRQAAKFGKSNRVQAVWADLAFESILAGRVAAARLGVPLLASIHDDPVNRLRVKKFPAWLVALYEHEFIKTLRAAKKIAVISDYMGAEYKTRYNVKSATLYPGVNADEYLPVKPLDKNKSPLVIGSVGSVNSPENFEALRKAVKQLNEEAGKERFRILHLGKWRDTIPPADVETTGWLPPAEFKKQLARFDFSFLSSSFLPQDAETGRMSFPMKITSYLQAGVPMLTFAPEESSAAKFTREHGCGFVCNQPDINLLAKKIESTINNEGEQKYWSAIEKTREKFSRQAFFQTFQIFVS